MADSTKALFSGYSTIMQVLDNIVQDNQQKAECRQQARGLISTMTKLETGIMIIFWNQILQRFQPSSASLQSSGQDLSSACAVYESTYGYIQSLRSIYSDIEKKVIDLTETEEYEQQRRRKHKRNRYMIISVAHLLVLVLRLQFKHLLRSLKEQYFLP